MRLARALTRRNKVLKFEGDYHGTHNRLTGFANDLCRETQEDTLRGLYMASR